MTVSPNRDRLRWQCRRGMLELDDLFMRFLDQEYDRLSLADQVAFERLLTEVDPLLQAWLMGQAEPEDAETRRLVALIRATPPY